MSFANRLSAVARASYVARLSTLSPASSALINRGLAVLLPFPQPDDEKLPQMKRFSMADVFPGEIFKLPYHAVHVRWKLSHNLPCYTADVVEDALSIFGNIVSFGQLSANSAIVVFPDLKTAAKPVNASRLGGSCCPILCTWWNNDMNSLSTRVDILRRLKRKNTFIVYDNEEIQKQRIQILCIGLLRLLHKFDADTNQTYDRHAFRK